MQFSVMPQSLSAESGILTFASRRVDELAAKYGTPLIMYDERVLRGRCRAYRRAAEANFSAGGAVYYANKAFCCSAMFRLLDEEGMSADVASGGELYAAARAGFPAERICMHGNSKLPGELELALDSKIDCICVDNETELGMLQELCARRGCIQKITLRITPCIDIHTHQKINTGGADSKFGIPLLGGIAEAAIKKAAAYSNLKLYGLQVHLGSQILELEPYLEATRVMLELLANAQAGGISGLTDLTLGGGFGIRYVEGQEPVDIEAAITRIGQCVKSECARLGIAVPRVNFEPGRSIVGDAALTLYTAGNVRVNGAGKIYAAVDGGMTDNPRYELYGAPYTVLNASKAKGTSTQTVTVAGKLCESGDIIQENVEIPEVSSGDLVAVLCTGAYNYSMASNYNRIPRPAVIFIDADGADRLVLRRETDEDMMRLDV